MGNESDVREPSKYRVFGFSCRCEYLDEDTIKLALTHKSIKGCAYILHDSDVIRQEDIDDPNTEYTEKDLNTQKKPHWHIVLECNPALPIATVAKWFNLPDNIVRKRLGAGAFRDYLAYLTHITKKSLDKKWQYEPEEVKGLKFPAGKPWCQDLSDYYDFKTMYIEKQLQDLSSWEHRILKGEVTPYDIMEKAPQYYIDHMNKIDATYRKFINKQPPPPYRWNYYVYGKGGAGKDLTSMALAIAFLTHKYPDVDFESMNEADLVNKGYIYFAGNGSTTLQEYAGQPIIIWADIRASTLIKTFGNTGNTFRALDMHPHPAPVKILYGNINLINEINIFNGVETYDEFINNLSISWTNYQNEEGEVVGKREFSEDTNQARRRFPFIIEVTTSAITLKTEISNLVDAAKNPFTEPLSVRNDMQILAENGLLAQKAKDFTLAGMTFETQKFIKEGKEKPALPANTFEIIDTPKKE